MSTNVGLGAPLEDVSPTTPAEADWLAHQRRWGRGWRQFTFSVVLLVYMLYVVAAVRQFTHAAAAANAAYTMLAVFAVVYLVSLRLVRVARPWPFWILYGALVVLAAGIVPLARAAGFALCLYLTILVVIRLGARSAPAVAGMALAALVVPVLVTSWHMSIGGAFETITPVALPIVGLSTYAVLRVQQGNQALTAARSELARLAAENERSRIARDLHDLLGHSLTTITVKAALARRLGETDPARALAEMAEVEVLARQSLSDVRAAVTSYRDVTLAGELANGRELLRAAGIAADLPRAVDMVEPGHQELLGWVVREGVTNIVRHAHASSCSVRLSAAAVEITDDGVGQDAPPGNGLSGLRERIAAAGGMVDAGPLQPRGWRLRASLAPDRDQPAQTVGS